MYSVKEKVYLSVFAILGVISFWFFTNYRVLAFPEYNIDFQISRDQAKQLSESQLNHFGLSLQDYTSATIFEIDETAKNFLERNIGVEETGKLAQNSVNVWHFNTRFFKPLEKSEYTFSFLPNGRFIGYSSEIPEDQEGKSLSQQESLKIAEEFLTSQANINLNEWQIVSSETKNRENRIDHQFIWEKKNFSLNDATSRMEVSIYGDRIGSYSHYLKIPESWLRQYENERSYNDLAQIAAESINYIFLGIAIIAVFIIQFRHHQLNLNFAKKIAIVIAVITFLATVNNFPIILYYFPTTQSLSAFTTQIILGSFSAAFFSGILTFLTVAAGEVVYRQQLKDKINLENILTKGLFTKTVNTNLFIGSFAGLIFLAYVVLFYFLGQQFNFWVPAETNYTDLFNTYIPWIYPLLIGLSAAVLEESMFRLFGITFLNKYLKNIYLSIFITSVTWAFLHSSYPQSPWYARGIEISFVGFVLGWLYVRFGILASISAHYTFNALQVAFLFLGSNNFYVTVTSFLIAFLPLLLAIIGLIYKFAKNGFISEQEFSNQMTKITKPAKKVVQGVQILTKYKHLTKKYVFIIIFTAVSLSIIAISLLYRQEYGSFLPHATKEEIYQKSQEELKSRNINIDNYLSTTEHSIFNIDPLIEKYFLENNGSSLLHEIYNDNIPTEIWSTRFFKPFEKTEYITNFSSDGTFYSFDYILDENSPGANLNSTEALRIAQNYLKDQGFDISTLDLVDQQSEKRTNRTDHYFTFEDKDFQFHQAKLRVNVDILGDKPSSFDQYIKLPEDFIRAETSTQFKDVIAQSILSLFFGTLIILFIINFLNQFRNEKLQFKKLIPLVVISISITIGSYLNSLPTFFAGYDTSISLVNYQTQQVFLFIVGTVFFGLLVWILLASFRNLWEENISPLLPNKNLNSYLNDALFVSYISQFIFIPAAVILSSVLSKFNLIATSAFTIDLGFDTFAPAFREIAQLQLALVGFIFTSSMLIILFKLVKSWLKVAVLLIIVVGISSTIGADNLTEFMKNFIPSIAFLLLITIFVLLFLRKNFLAYIGTIYVALLSSSGVSFLVEPNMFYKMNGLILIILALLPIIIFVFYRLRFK